MTIIDPITAINICGNFKIFAPFVFLFIVLVFPFDGKWLKKFEIIYSKITCKKSLAIAFIGIFTFVANALVSLKFYMPLPSISDEFSYLLAADTFAQGRLTNPTHPMWIFFDSFHIFFQPTYMSKYPPGQGLILALGQVLTGYPIVGVWLSMALACSATCWMLQAWLPARWAFFGSLLMVLDLGLFSYWSQSYWGGAVAVIGGALIFGALPRIIRKPTISNSLWFGLGLAVLANTRPYEGLVISLLPIFYLLIWLIKTVKNKKLELKVLIKQVILPLTALLFVVAIMMGYYNFVITGKFWLMPYTLYESNQGNLPTFLWQKVLPEIPYNHKEIRDLYRNWVVYIYNTHQGFSNCVFWSWQKLVQTADFFLCMPFVFILSFWPLLIKNKRVIFATSSILLLLIAELQLLYLTPHYVAPAVCLLYFLIIQCLRKIYLWRWRGKPVGRLIVWSVKLYFVLLVILLVTLTRNPFIIARNPFMDEFRKFEPLYWSSKRANLLSKLENEEGQHLVIVKYLPGHSYHNEWVFNRADIDNAKVVWARSMGDEKNCKLKKYFQNRKIWMLELGNEIDPIKEFYSVKPCD